MIMIVKMLVVTCVGRPPGPEAENSVDRESYSLAAGLGLGLVMLGVSFSSNSTLQ